MTYVSAIQGVIGLDNGLLLTGAKLNQWVFIF